MYILVKNYSNLSDCGGLPIRLMITDQVIDFGTKENFHNEM